MWHSLIFWRGNGSPIKVRRLLCLKMTVMGIIGSVLMLTLLVQMGKILERYAEGPTYVSTTIDHQKNVNFPAITICPNKIQYNETRLREHGFALVKDYNDAREERNISWSSNGTLSPWELFEYLTVAPRDLLEAITVKIANESIIRVNISDEMSLKSQGHRKFGRCWTFYPEEWIRNKSIHSIRMIFKYDVKLYIHQKDQFLDISGRMGYKVYLGEVHATQINYQDLTMLEKDESQGAFYCKRMVYDECMYEVLGKIMLKEAGCVAPWLNDKSKKICVEQSKIKIAFWIAWNRITNQEKDCPTPCDFLWIQTGDKNFIDTTNNETCSSTYYFSSKVTFNEEQYLYTGLSLFAEIGGYLGLLLGLSFFNLADLIGGCFEKRIKVLEEELTALKDKGWEEKDHRKIISAVRH